MRRWLWLKRKSCVADWGRPWRAAANNLGMTSQIAGSVYSSILKSIGIRFSPDKRKYFSECVINVKNSLPQHVVVVAAADFGFQKKKLNTFTEDSPIKGY